MASSRNLGQVAGIFVGTTPPENIRLVWWDSTPSQLCHKIYDYNLKQWVILNQSILSMITYNELKNIALTVGLSLGKFYVITDRGNSLALSISRTKVQYVNSVGNLLVDDLGSNAQYFISSNNITIDGQAGDFNESTTKLDFPFSLSAPNYSTAYLLAKDETVPYSSIFKFIKFRLNTLISAVSGNTLSWNNGIYLNLSKSILDIIDVKGGIVSYNKYEEEQEIQNQSIQNIADNYSVLSENVEDMIKNAISSSNIMSTAVPFLETSGEPIDPLPGDSLYVVLSKMQRYINKFKVATGISLSSDFKIYPTKTPINRSDSVDTALRKTAKYLSILDANTGNQIPLSDVHFHKYTTKPSPIVMTDVIARAISKLDYFVTHIEKSYINKGIIGFDEIQAAGVLPTDIFRLELRTSFNIEYCGMGAILYPGTIPMFNWSSTEPFNPYSIQSVFQANYPKPVFFMPILYNPANSQQVGYNGALMRHVTGEDAVIQFIIAFTQSGYNFLKNANLNKLSYSISGTIYSAVMTPYSGTVNINQITTINMPMTAAQFASGSYQHLLLKLTLNAVT